MAATSPVLRRLEVEASDPRAAAISAGVMTDAGAWFLEHEGRSFTVLRDRANIAGRYQVPDWRWHISIAGQDGDVPPWDLIVAVGHQLRPGVVFVIGLPPRTWWINVHTGCLHLWQLGDQALEDLWRNEGRGDTPS